MAEEEWRHCFLMVVNSMARRPGLGENSGEGGKRKKLGLLVAHRCQLLYSGGLRKVARWWSWLGEGKGMW